MCEPVKVIREFADTAKIPYFTLCTRGGGGGGARRRSKNGKSHWNRCVTLRAAITKTRVFTVGGGTDGRGRDDSFARLTDRPRPSRAHTRVYASSRAPRRRLTDAHGTRAEPRADERRRRRTRANGRVPDEKFAGAIFFFASGGLTNV